MEGHNNDLLVFLLGIITGLILCFIGFNLFLESFNSNRKKQEKEKEENDPANWWKYGKDPYEYSNADEDEF